MRIKNFCCELCPYRKERFTEKEITLFCYFPDFLVPRRMVKESHGNECWCPLNHYKGWTYKTSIEEYK